MSKTVLITGATGFLGSNLLKKLVELKYEIVVLKRSFSKCARIDSMLNQVRFYDIDKTGLSRVFSENRIDIIIHCATSYGSENTEPKNLLESNLIFPLELLDLGSKGGVSCFINTDTILDRRINIYSLSKKQFREWFGIYANHMICINVALEHFYGPHDDKSKFISFIINKLLTGENRIELTAGQQERDFIYIDDVVSAFILIIAEIPKFKSNVINYEIATDSPIKLRDFVELSKKLTKSNITLDFGALAYRQNEVMKLNVDTSEIRKLGWEPKVPLIEGLQKTIEIERRGIIK